MTVSPKAKEEAQELSGQGGADPAEKMTEMAGHGGSRL